MQEVQAGKAISSTRAKPFFVTIGDHRQINTGRWNHSLMADWVLVEGNGKHIAIGSLAKAAHGSGTPRNKKNVRRNLRALHLELMERGYLLLISYENGKGAQFVKLYDQRSEEDRQALEQRLGKMQERGDILNGEIEKARQIAEIS